MFAFSSAFFTPSLGLVIAGLANNKIEGFAYMKSTGFIMLIPALLLLESFKGMGQCFLALFPNFWFTQGMLIKMLPGFPMLSQTANINFYWYMLVGAITAIVYAILTFRFFMKRAIK